MYNEKHKLTKRKHIQISFNELRHILNLAQIMAMRIAPPEGVTAQKGPASKDDTQDSSSQVAKGDDNNDDSKENIPFNGPRLITFDGDQTLYADGANFDSNPRLAHYLYLLLKNGVHIAVVTAAGYEYDVAKYEYRLSGLLHYFKSHGLTDEECQRFYLFGGECNYLLRLGNDFRLRPVHEDGPGGWCTSTRHIKEAPGNWTEDDVHELLNAAEACANHALSDLNLRGRVIRKRRAIGLIPNTGEEMPRESLDEVVLRMHETLQKIHSGSGPRLPWCAFNGGTDVWLDVGNKRVGVKVLQSYLGILPGEMLHIGDQFLNTGNDYAARAVSPCIWIINPMETTYILKSILRLANVSIIMPSRESGDDSDHENSSTDGDLLAKVRSQIDFNELERRSDAAKKMDVYTGELIQ